MPRIGRVFKKRKYYKKKLPSEAQSASASSETNDRCDPDPSRPASTSTPVSSKPPETSPRSSSDSKLSLSDYDSGDIISVAK